MNNILMSFNMQKYSIPISYKRYMQLPDSIRELIFAHKYYNVETVVKEETFNSFMKYLSDSSEPEINSDNIYEYYLLSQEFGILTDYFSDKIDEKMINLSILCTNTIKNKSKNEIYVSMHLDDIIENHSKELLKIPINSLFNIFYHKERVLNDHQKAYDFIIRESSKYISLLVLLGSLDGDKLNPQSKSDSFEKSKERFGFCPKIQINQSFFNSNSFEKKINQYKSIVSEKIPALEKENQQLRAETRQFKEENQQLKNETIELNQQITNETREINEENQRLKKEMKELKEENQQLKKETKELNQQIKNETRELKEENQQIKRETRELNQQLKNEIREIKEENQRLKKETKELKEENQQLKNETREINEENQRFKKETKELKEENQRFVIEAREFKVKSQRFKKDVQGFREENQALREETSEIKEENQQLIEEAQELREENQQLIKETRKFKKENQRFREETREFEEENQQLELVINSFISAIEESNKSTYSFHQTQKTVLHFVCDTNYFEAAKYVISKNIVDVNSIWILNNIF